MTALCAACSMTAAKLAFAIARSTIIVGGQVTGAGTSMTARQSFVAKLFAGRMASWRVITGEDTGETWIDASFMFAP